MTWSTSRIYREQAHLSWTTAKQRSLTKKERMRLARLDERCRRLVRRWKNETQSVIYRQPGWEAVLTPVAAWAMAI